MLDLLGGRGGVRRGSTWAPKAAGVAAWAVGWWLAISAVAGEAPGFGRRLIGLFRQLPCVVGASDPRSWTCLGCSWFEGNGFCCVCLSGGCCGDPRAVASLTAVATLSDAATLGAAAIGENSSGFKRGSSRSFSASLMARLIMSAGQEVRLKEIVRHGPEDAVGQARRLVVVLQARHRAPTSRAPGGPRWSSW